MGGIGWMVKMVVVLLPEKEKEDKNGPPFFVWVIVSKRECLFSDSYSYSVFLSLTASFSPGFFIVTIFLIPATALVPYL